MNTHSLEIKILVDNQAPLDLVAEHGLSIWIEAEGKRILFDTGQGGALEPNAREIGVDLAQTDILILSHGHYDHTGGIAQVLRHNQKTNVYCHPGITQVHYSIKNGTMKSIQIPAESKAALDHMPAPNLHWISRPVHLSENIGITGPIPRETVYEDTGGSFYLDPQGERPDPISDDMAMWIRTDKGLVICVGCCHAGLVNTLYYIQALTGEKEIRAVIGGFHLLNAGRQRLDHTITALHYLKPATIVPCHCTGEKATQLLIDAIGDKVSLGRAGMELLF